MVIVFCFGFCATFAKCDENVECKNEPAWDYEYIDFENTLKIIEYEKGYEIVLDDQSSIYVNSNGNVTEDMVGVTGRNTRFDADTKYTTVYDNHNNKIIEVLDDDYLVKGYFKDYICIVSMDNQSEDCSLRIYSKENGELILNTTVENYFNGLNFSIYDDGTFLYKTEDGKIGFSDVYGNIIIKALYEDVVRFNGGFFGLKNGIWSYYDMHGNVVKTFAALKPQIHNNCYVSFSNGNLCEVYNREFKRLFRSSIYTVINSLCEDTFIACFKDSIIRDTILILNADGEVIAESSEGYVDYLGDGILKVDNVRLIKSDGNIIADNCHYITDIGDNGYIGISTDDFDGYINTEGEKMIELDNGYYVQGSFSGGMAPIMKKGSSSLYGEISYIDESGRIMLTSIDDAWTKGYDFKNGTFLVEVHGEREGEISKRLVKCTYDTPSEWATETIEWAIKNNLLPEKHQKRYKRDITREAFCEIAYELPMIKNRQINETYGVEFLDTDNEKIKHLYSLGIINGVGENKFKPNNIITREEAATILCRILNITSEKTPDNKELFSDDYQISDWAKESVYIMKNVGIMQGVGDNRFSPAEHYTTEQAVAAIVRLYNANKKITSQE